RAEEAGACPGDHRVEQDVAILVTLLNNHNPEKLSNSQRGEPGLRKLLIPASPPYALPFNISEPSGIEMRMTSDGTKVQEVGHDRPLVLVLNASPATSFEEEIENSPEALKALQNEVDIDIEVEALSQLLRVWWIPGAEEGDSTEIGLDDVSGLKREYPKEEVEGLELFALCLSALLSDHASTMLQDEPDQNTARISASPDNNYVANILRDLAAESLSAQSRNFLHPLKLARLAPHFIEFNDSDDLQSQLQEQLSQPDAPEIRIVLLRDADSATTQSVLLVFTSETAQNVRRLLESSQKSLDEEDIKEEADDETIGDEDEAADRPVQIIFVVDSANEEVNGQKGTIELIGSRFEIDQKQRRDDAKKLLTLKRAWEQVKREIESFGLPLKQDFRNHISMQLDEERDGELDDDEEKPALMCAKLHVDPDAFQEQSALRQQIGTPQPDVAHPEQREVAEEVFCKAEQALFGTSNADWTSKFNSVSFVVLTPNFNSLQSQTADRVTRTKLEGGRVLKHTKVPYAVMKKHREWMEEEAKNPKTLFVIIADECHFAPTKDGAHDWLLNNPKNPALSGENVLRLLVSATPQNVLSQTSRVADSNIVRWFKPASMYRSMDYYGA
ncbi:GREB1-like protein, partial [Hondaea fermentalgiana]